MIGYRDGHEIGEIVREERMESEDHYLILRVMWSLAFQVENVSGYRQLTGK